MKNVEPSKTARGEGKWTPVEVVHVFPAASDPQAVPRPRVKSDLLSNSLSYKDRSGVFFHQLSQALTSLRGVLELALLIEGDEQEYRRAIQQSLAQAEGLVQVFKSYRAMPEVETTGFGDEPVGLEEVVRLALEQLHPLADSRRLTVHLESGANCVVQTGSSRLLGALRQGLLCAMCQSPPGGKLEVTLSRHVNNACLTISASAQGAKSVSQPGFGPNSGHECTKEVAGEIVEGDWTAVRSAVEALDDSLLAVTTEAFPLFCEIWIPLSRS
jgi:hypothetical protein